MLRLPREARKGFAVAWMTVGTEQTKEPNWNYEKPTRQTRTRRPHHSVALQPGNGMLFRFSICILAISEHGLGCHRAVLWNCLSCGFNPQQRFFVNPSEPKKVPADPVVRCRRRLVCISIFRSSAKESENLWNIFGGRGDRQCSDGSMDHLRHGSKE